ncbi:hypothetical protein HQR03_00635 [Psychrobacter okhotskensis]|uniref:hypothetical protein n=1 Tax=Psychrobacter okhotskensis TaxID=212403 RepID=UPI0015660F7E|nr:hypothetical protein [Psychrobacter okhotskensis]NRD69047.1 hypothetical protein [Psychrobacter okhotskensis]
MAKSKISTIIFSTVGAIMFMSLSNVASAKTVNEIIKEYYPIYNKAQQCQGIIANNGSRIDEDVYLKSGYCIKIDRQLEVKTKQGKRLYVVVIGEVSFNKEGGNDSGSHADTGLVGMFVLKPQDSGWEVEYANPVMNAGASGGGLKDWKLIQVAPDIWGFINIHSDSHGSMSFSEYLLLAPDHKSGKIIKSHIGGKSTFSNTPTAPSGCSKDRKVEYCTLLKAKLNIDKTTLINGFYPLEITVNGHEYNYNGSEKKTYNNQVYTIKYEPKKGYQAPKNYPLQ